MVDSWIILQVKIDQHFAKFMTAIIIELVSVAKLQDNSKQYEMKLVRLL